MAQPTFQFTTPANQPNDQAGLQQYIAQGQNLINPGQAQVAGSNPVGAAGAANLANALKTLQSQPTVPQLSPDASQAALQQGAAMNPNSPSGINMGGVGPTQQNLALAQGLQNAVQPDPTQFMPQQPPNLGINFNYGGSDGS